MGSLIFVIKSFVITIVILLLLQIKVGTQTLEEQLTHTVRNSGIHQPAQYVADGLTRLVRNTWRVITASWNTNFGQSLDHENAPGGRQSRFNLQRSAEYVEKKARQAKNKVKTHLQDEGIIEKTLDVNGVSQQVEENDEGEW